MNQADRAHPVLHQLSTSTVFTFSLDGNKSVGLIEVNMQKDVSLDLILI